MNGIALAHHAVHVHVPSGWLILGALALVLVLTLRRRRGR